MQSQLHCAEKRTNKNACTPRKTATNSRQPN